MQDSLKLSIGWDAAHNKDVLMREVRKKKTFGGDMVRNWCIFACERHFYLRLYLQNILSYL